MSYNSIYNKELFSGKNIVVTGGGSGIGRCIAHELSSLGSDIILIGRNKEKLKTVMKEIKSSNGNASYYVCDIREEDKVHQCTKEIFEEFKEIYGLVNNAGGQFPSPAECISQKGFETVVRTNLIGGFLFCREVFKSRYD